MREERAYKYIKFALFDLMTFGSLLLKTRFSTILLICCCFDVALQVDILFPICNCELNKIIFI